MKTDVSVPCRAPEGRRTGSFGGVIVAEEFLAEGASVVDYKLDNKVDVRGGALCRFMVGPE